MARSPRPIRVQQGVALGLIALLILASAALSAGAGALRAAMFSWTGESGWREQIKGTLALAWLTLSTPAPQTDPYVPMPHTGLPPYGVNTFLEQEVEAEKVERSLALVAEAGFHWVRQQFPWEDIEISAKGDYWDHKWDVDAWAKYDRIVAAAERHGLELIVRLDNPPAWSRARGNEPGWELAPPDDYADYGDFVYAVVSRYRGRVRYYQIWNEPNIYPEWGQQDANPEAYVELLKVAYTRAKEADPDCVILSAALAQNTEQAGWNLSDLTYLERMYRAGAADYFDILGAQAYGLWTGPQDARASTDRTNFPRVTLLREIMVRHGDAGTPIWVTEVGWNTTPLELGQFPYGRVTEAQQAAYAVAAYERQAREWPWLGVMNYWYLRRPSDAERDQPWYYFRLLEPDFTPLPAYEALADLATAPPTVHAGYHQEDHWALDYRGDWRTEAAAEAVLGARAMGARGAEVEFAVEGEALALVLGDAAQAEGLVVELDGREVNLGRPLRGVASPAPALTITDHLGPGRHDVRVRVVGESVALDGLIVTAAPTPAEGLAGVLRWTLGGLAAVGLVAVGLVWWRRRRRGR